MQRNFNTQSEYSWRKGSYSYGREEMQSDEEKFFVTEHDYYYTPGVHYVSSILSSLKISTNYTRLTREFARFFYYRLIKDKDYIAPKFLDPKTETDQAIANEKTPFYNEVWDMDYVPGYTPLEKALYLIQAVISQSPPKDDEGQPQLSQVNIERLNQGMPDREVVESPEYNKMFTNGRHEIADPGLKMRILQKLGKVDSFGKTFEIKTKISEKRVANSDTHKLKRLVEIGDLPNAPLYQRILPNFKVKLLTKDLVVNTPIKREESKQKIIVLVDFSGSMHGPLKQDWVHAILANRLMYCMKEECEIFFSYFLTKSDLVKNNFQFHHAYDEKTSLQLYQSLNFHPSGGDTEIGDIVDSIRNEIMTNKKLFNLPIDLSKEQPEILIINDGQDSIKTTKLTWKTNAICLMQENEELAKLCEKTGGKFITIKE